MSTPISYGPHLIAHATGTLRAALLIRPAVAIETLQPLIGEPNAIYSRALEQHAILAKTLKYFGVEVTIIDDPCGTHALEAVAADLAVCFASGAILMRPPALNRTQTMERVQMEFARIDVPIGGQIMAPGIIEGSDVILAGDVAFIGVSKRSNTLGRTAFADCARANGYRPVEVKLDSRAPSLRSVASAVSTDTIVVATERVDEGAFDGFKLVRLERGEELGAGVFALGNGRVIANMRYRTALDQIRRAGIAVESIDLGEFGKAGITPSNLILAIKRS